MELFKNFVIENYGTPERFSKENAIPFRVAFINYHRPAIIRNNIIYRRTKYRFSKYTENGNLARIIEKHFGGKTSLAAQSLNAKQASVRYYIGQGALVYQSWLYTVDFKLGGEA